MSNTFDENNQEIQIFQQDNCTVSYILNGGQPVRCSIIGDQPLFYMDFEDAVYEDEEEGGFDDLFAIEKLEHSIEALRDRITSYSPSPSACHDSLGDNRFNEFLEDSAFLTHPHFAQTSGAGSEEALDKLLTTLNKSRMASEYMAFAVSQGVKIEYSRQIETGLYDRAGKTILINPDRPFADQKLLAARELRRVWQHKNGALINPLLFHPDQAVLVNRAQIADLTVNMVRVAWELQLSDEKQAWERIEGSPMADLAYAFARESYLDFRTLNNGLAGAAVFENWFLSERCRNEDKELIQHMLADYSGYVFDTEAPSKQVTAELIIALGSVPFGKNYLAPYVQTIMEDAVFTEIRDRSNANFLWFIKFERSFRETEQELQTHDDVNGHDDRHGRSHNKNKRFGNDEKTSNIITLQRSGETKSRRSPRKAAQGNKKDANIVYLQQGSEEL